MSKLTLLNLKISKIEKGRIVVILNKNKQINSNKARY
jgi:hypothetical protein